MAHHIPSSIIKQKASATHFSGQFPVTMGLHLLFAFLFLGSCLFPVGSHALAGLVGDIIVQIVCKAKGFRLPAAGGFHSGVFHLGVPERSGLALIHVVHLQHKAIGQCVASADLPDQGLTDDLCFQFIKQFLVDGALDLLPCTIPATLTQGRK